MSGINYQPSNTPDQTPQRQVRFILIPIGLIITLFIAILQFFARGKNPAPEIDQTDMRSGINFYLDGDYDLALVMFNQVLFQQPESGEAYNNLGLVYEAKDDLSSALANFSKAIQFMNEPAVPYCNRSNIYAKTGYLALALADLNMAIELDPQFSKAYYNRGVINLALDDPQAAITDFNQALEFSTRAMPSALKIEQLRATLPDSFGIMEMDELTSPAADPQMTYAMRARAYILSGDPQSATADLETALQYGLDPAIADQIRSLIETPAPTFLPGHWQGTTINGAFDGPVSFDLDAEGVIHNFKMDIYIAFDTPCPISAEGITLDSDQWFSFYFDAYHTKNSIPVQGVLDTSRSASGNVSPLEVDCFAYPNQWIKANLPTGITWSANWQSDSR